MAANATKKIDVPAALENVDWQSVVDGLRRVSRAGRAMKASGLSERAVILLLKDMTGCNATDIRKILAALPQLDKRFTVKARP